MIVYNILENCPWSRIHRSCFKLRP